MDRFPELAQLCRVVAELDEKIGQTSVVVVFGSRARGDHEPWSDYDVLVLSDQISQSDNWLYHSVKDLRLDLQRLTFTEYEARLNFWVKNEGDGNSGKQSRAEIGMSVSALDGICLTGVHRFSTVSRPCVTSGSPKAE